MANIGRRLFDLGSSSHAEHLARDRPALDAVRALAVDRTASLAPPEAASLVESFAARFNAAPSAGDHLRLPPPAFSNIPGPEIRASVQRVIDAGAGPLAGFPADSLEKERALRAMLVSYRAAFELILARAQDGARQDPGHSAGHISGHSAGRISGQALRRT